MLLLVVLDYLGSTYFRLVRVIPKFAQCPALAQEIPVLVQLDFQLTQATPVIAYGFPYYLVQVSTAVILALAANTGFTGFPRLAAVLANDRFMPRHFADQRQAVARRGPVT